MADNERSRRRFLRASGLLGAVGVAGCSSLLEETTSTPPEVGETSDVEPLASTETDTPAAGATPTAATDSAGTEPAETETPTATATPGPSVTIGVAEEIDRQRPQIPDQPDPDWVVAGDGSGDYESLGDAIRIAKEGETIGLKAGTYEITDNGQTKDKELQFVGAGRSATTLNVTTDLVDWATFAFHGLTVQKFPEFGASNVELRFYDCSVEPSLVPQRGLQATLVAVRSRFGSRTKTVSLDAKGCLFEGEVYHRNVRATDCRFVAGADTQFTAKKLRRCVFEAPADVGLQDGDDLSNTVFTGLQLEILGTGEASEIANCRFRRPDGATQVARFQGICDVTYSRFDGSCVPNCRFLFANVFEADGDVDYYIDGKIPPQLYANAFVGGGIRVDSVRGPIGCDSESAAYLEAAGIGNYYGTLDESDEDGDGVIDLPYPIPGEAKLTDRYPLASADIKQYLPLSTDFEVCGYA